MLIDEGEADLQRYNLQRPGSQGVLGRVVSFRFQQLNRRAGEGMDARERGDKSREVRHPIELYPIQLQVVYVTGANVVTP